VEGPPDRLVDVPLVEGSGALDVLPELHLGLEAEVLALLLGVVAEVVDDVVVRGQGLGEAGMAADARVTNPAPAPCGEFIPSEGGRPVEGPCRTIQAGAPWRWRGAA
jgi:hypothetical protein